MALQFNGGSDRLTMLGADFTAPPATMACWFNPNFIDAGKLMSTSDSTAQEEFVVDISNGFVRGIAKDANVAAVATTAIVAVANTWFHAVATFSSATGRSVYINGNSVGSDTTSMIPVGVDRSAIGADFTGGTPFVGAIAYPSKWSVALSPDDISSLYANGSGLDPRQVHHEALIEFSTLGASPFIESVSGLAWNMVGSPSLVLDPFQLSVPVVTSSGNFAVRFLQTTT